jgi:DNA polymerase-3 subunit epsilon
MKFTKPICFFDLEATGLDTQRDRAVQFAARYRTVSGVWSFQSTLINPEIPIPPESTEIHGITDEMVKDAPKFRNLADIIHNSMKGCILAGYNLIHFDIPMLWEEFYRAKINWEVDQKLIIDVGNIFKLKHPRDLSAAVKTYCHREMEDAHNALADVEATADVLMAQLDAHDDLFDMDENQLAEFSQMDKRVDLAGIIVLNKDGVPVFNTKRNKGVPVVEDQGYANWMLRSDFSENTKQTILKIIS